MKRFISILLTIMIVVPIFSNSINLVQAETSYSVSYRVGPYSFNTDTQGNQFHTIDGTKYYCADDYEDTAIDKIVSLQNKNVVFELHDNKISKMYTMDEVLVPQIKVETDVKDGIYYQNGKFSKSSFNLVVKLSNRLSSKFQEVDLLNKITSTEKSRIYNYLTKLEIEPSGNVVDFGSSGWWVWKEYTTNISETMNQKISVNEIKEYSYAVNLQYVLNMPSYNIELYVTPTFDNTKYNRVTNKVKIGNLDYQEEKTEEKKKTSNTGKTVAQASNELSNMQSTVSLTKNYLSSSQKTQINDFVNLWVSELIFAKYVDKSDIKEKVSEKVANKMLDNLGFNTSVMLLPGTIEATTYLQTETVDGEDVFVEFYVRLLDFDFGNSGMPTMSTGSGTATLYNMDGEKLDSGPIIIAFADVCAFCEQLQKVAKDTIFDASKIYLGLAGISAESTAEALSSKMMTTLLNNNYTKKVFKHVDAKDVKKALEKITVTGAKKCNNQIFKLITTPKKSSTLVNIDCPVDVTVYDNDGNICAVIKDDVVDSAYEDIFVNVVDSRKNIYLVGDDYSFEITGTDTGTMDYTVTEFDEDGNTTAKIDYDDVQLIDGCKFYSYVPDATNEHQSLFYLTNDKNEVVTLEGSCGSNITWSLSEDGVLNINGNGKMSDYYYKISASSYYHKYSPWYSFRNNIKKVVISDGVTSIGGDAFEECANLTNITIPDSVTSIGDYAFENCTSLSDISIPDGITNIGHGAFSSCSSLIDVTIPNSVTSIGDWAFSSCSNLKSIVIPDSVTNIGEYVFYNCINLNDILIPNGVVSIGNYAFNNCTSLSNITIPNSVTTIGEYTFSRCTNLKAIVIPDSVADIGKYAFSECTNLTSIKMPANITIIKHDTFSYCNNLINVNIPNNVTCIESFAFRYCRKIECIEIPSSVEQIGEEAFAWCNNLSKVTLGSGIKRIEKNAFYKSGQYTSIKNITDVYYSGTLEDWCKIEFDNEHANPVVENFYINNQLLTHLTITSAIKEIPAYAFNGFNCLQNVTISHGISTIGTGAFQWCGGLTSLSIPTSVTSIEDTAFSNCTKLSTVYYSGTSEQWNQIQIGNNNDELLYATIHCTDKTLSNMSISLDKSNLILYVGSSETLNAILTPENAPNKTIEWTSSNPNVATVSNGLVSAKSVGTATITAKTSNGLTATCTVTVTPSNEDVFEYTIFKNPGEETSVAIHGYTGTETELTIPNKIEGYPVISIWSEAFIDCTELTKVSIPNSITYIGDDAFRGCINLKEVSIPSSVKGIGAGAFRDCKKLTNITIPSNVTTINSWTFCNCQSLQQIQFTGSIIEIGSHAFCDCYNLKAINIPSTVTMIGEQAFWGCSKLSTINIPTNITRIEYATFENCTSLNDVHYEGSKSQWEKIYIESDNEYLLTANIHFKTLEQVDVTGITLNKKSISLIVGQSENLTATVLPSNATDTTITWTSSNSKVVTVNNGKITGINVGTAKITAKTSNNISATCFVTVSPTSNMEEIVGDINFDGVVSIIDATEVQMHLAKFIELSDTQKNVADTNGDSVISILDATEIQMYLAKYIDHFKQPSSINLNTNSITLVVGNTQTLSASILPNDATNKTISWFSSNNSIATVTYGVVTAKAPGTAIITAKTYNGKTSECTITVKPVEPSSISLNKNSLSLYEGDTYQLSATISPSNVADKNLTWSSNNSSVISVDSNGKVTAKSIGSATVTVKTSNEKTAKCNITVSKQYIEIYTEDELYNINSNLDGKYILMNDIAVGLPSIGSSTSPFTGVFDGNGHTITIDYSQEYIGNSDFYSGIFGYTKGAEIKNLNVDGTLTVSLKVSKSTCSNYCGGIAAFAIDTNFSNCNNNATITSSVEIDETISCSAYAYSAGIVGWCSGGYLVDCTNTGEIKAVSNMNLRSDALSGGIVAMGSATDLENCVNTGRVYAEANTNSSNYWAVAYAGGMIANNNIGELSNCKNYGKIVSKCSPSVSTTYDSIAAAGGLVGRGDTYYSYCTSVDLGIIATGNSFSTVYFSKWIALGNRLG